jgi:hypothetical protein
LEGKDREQFPRLTDAACFPGVHSPASLCPDFPEANNVQKAAQKAHILLH